MGIQLEENMSEGCTLALYSVHCTLALYTLLYTIIITIRTFRSNDEAAKSFLEIDESQSDEMNDESHSFCILHSGSVNISNTR